MGLHHVFLAPNLGRYSFPTDASLSSSCSSFQTSHTQHCPFPSQDLPSRLNMLKLYLSKYIHSRLSRGHFQVHVTHILQFLPVILIFLFHFQFHPPIDHCPQRMILDALCQVGLVTACLVNTFPCVFTALHFLHRFLVHSMPPLIFRSSCRFPVPFSLTPRITVPFPVARRADYPRCAAQGIAACHGPAEGCSL